MTDEILTLKEVAALLKVAEKTIATMAQQGELPAFKVGEQWRFCRTNLEAWIEVQSRSTALAKAPIVPSSPLAVSINGLYELDERLYQLRRAGKPVALEPKAFDVLVYLIRYRDRVVTKDELLTHLWPEQVVTESSLTQCIAKARKALQNGTGPSSIHNVYGRGYRFILPVVEGALKTYRRQKQQIVLPPQFSSPHPEARAYFMRGRNYLFQFASASLLQARRMYEQAISLDPQYAAAYAALAWTYLLEWTWLWNPEPLVLDRALMLAQQAVALDDTLAVAHLTLGYVSLFRRQHTQAIAETERSLALEPCYAWAHAMLAEMLVSVGRPQEAIHLIEKAMELEPQSAALFSASLGFTYRALHRCDEAVAALQRTVTHNPNFPSARLFLAVLYSEMGQRIRAKEQLSVLRRLTPQLSANGLKARLPYQDRAETERVIVALSKVGLS